jgi:dCTP deaminase
MNNNREDDIVLQYAFEVIERICRFYIHLQKTREVFYSGLDDYSASANDKLLFIQSYNSCILRLLRISINLARMVDTKSNKEIVGLFECIMSALSVLHHQLVHLPRPREPIEIRRFCRMIDKYIINISDDGTTGEVNNKNCTKISIYISELIGEDTYSKDPLSEFKDKNLKIIEDSFSILNASGVQPSAMDCQEGQLNGTLHITIPRVEANNPCRWPTLIHEVAHHIERDEFFNNKPIDQDFLSKLDNSERQFIDHYISETNHIIDLKKWLSEIWCDLFAAVVIGPSFWFSQYSAFITSNSIKETKSHPPAIVRLRLIRCILMHRFSSSIWKDLKDIMNRCQETLLSNEGTGTDYHSINQMTLLFQEYFLECFFENENGLQTANKELNKKIQIFTKQISGLNTDIISLMVKSLNDGLPIPSKRDLSTDNYSEKPSNIQEVLLASCIFRNNQYKDQIFKALESLATDEPEDIFTKKLENSLIPIISRFDFSVIRSIQVSEWFDILIPEDKKVTKRDCKLKRNKGGSVLVDWEIEELIKNKELLIIPLMNLEEQLGSTSLDIRLGTSFQLFYPNQHGIFDSTDSTAIISFQQSSLLKDLDFLEGLTLFPGQFVLGHSMEYLRFPDWIAAEVEGRSSFARLGIEIHMTAGFVDPGYEGVLTYEIFNAGANPIRLYPSTRIAQLRFFTTNAPSKSYDIKPAKKYLGHLAHNNSLQFKDYEIKRIQQEKDRNIKDNCLNGNII